MKRIVVGVDGTEGADRALDAAARLAQLVGAELVVVSVVQPHGLSESALAPFAGREHASYAEVLESLASQIAIRAKERVEAVGVAGVGAETRVGDVAQVILEIADEKQADAIVVGKRGTGRLAGLLVGSVSQKLVSLAQCPVLVVP
jgi:nucleotide-binding universal stress UspA family protein